VGHQRAPLINLAGAPPFPLAARFAHLLRHRRHHHHPGSSQPVANRRPELGAVVSRLLHALSLHEPTPNCTCAVSSFLSSLAQSIWHTCPSHCSWRPYTKRGREPLGMVAVATRAVASRRPSSQHNQGLPRLRSCSTQNLVLVLSIYLPTAVLHSGVVVRTISRYICALHIGHASFSESQRSIQLAW
jgi:hypothetical protein